ncbi:phage terminase large subunit [Gilvimarinus sp. 1_MG-2023]|uniref:phage terminase large subunit n=1 Tax=Gilvimarinus sp. 1_MG-2023 TaxID=3062638 RepID=UPI0026E38863|nr:phage terminase large subunit [Gilvimarinus sp. 1_MG-2023]MDO6747190.1 phage terminase large subunit [Gilvimarinus sp. 1_MG-2023]
MQAATREQIELLTLLEEQHRQRARDDLNHYCRYIEIPGVPLLADSCKLGDKCDDPKCKNHEITMAFYPDNVEPAEHHELLNSALQKVEAGEIKRLMVFMPPGSAKSTYASVVFPSYYMGKNPLHNIICASYASGLAKKFGRKVRSICKSSQFKELWNSALNQDNQAANDWSLNNGSTYMSGGILSGITGNRADGLIIDDPVKGREDADSPVIREKTWDAYLNDLDTRLKPEGWQVIIQTRWHEDDLSGRILPENYDGESGWVKSRQGEDWYVICLQAECEREDDPLGRKIGEWLWPKWFTPKYWRAKKQKQGERNWSALFQQRPKPSEGSLVKRAWPRRYRTPPVAFSRIVLSLDTAYKPEQINDPSVIGAWGQLFRGDMAGHYLLDVWRDRVEYPDLKRALIGMYEKWNPSAVLIEDKASGQSLIQECRAKTQMPVIAIDTEGQNKVVRLVDVSPIIESGQLWLPEKSPWIMDYESELFGFPLATHDDQVDMTSQYLKWARRNGGQIVHESTGVQRAALSEGDQHDYDDDGYSVSGGNDFGGFL